MVCAKVILSKAIYFGKNSCAVLMDTYRVC